MASSRVAPSPTRMVWVGVSPHGHCISSASRRASARVQQRDPETGPQRRLERGEGDFAVALGVVGISDVQPGTGDLNGKEEPAAEAEMSNVEVAAVEPGGVDERDLASSGCHAHQAEKRAQVEAQGSS